MPHIDLTMTRSNCFKLLAVCFYEPDKELFLEESLCENLAALFAACNLADAAAAAQKMQGALEEKNQEEMMVDYARLFIGPFEMIAPPYGSVYLESNKRLMGDSTLIVQKKYQEAGLTREVQEAPDHIALELEFMHYLCLQESSAAAQDKKDEAFRYSLMQNEFISQLLAPWIGDFCGNIRKGTDNEFYRQLAYCLEAFVGEMTSLCQAAGLLKQPEDSNVCQASV